MFGFCHLKEATNKNYIKNYGTNNGGYVVLGWNGDLHLHKENTI